MMDSIFLLEQGDRAVFLLNIMDSLGCTYICLWQYFQPSNSLISLDGIYKGENDVARRLFQEYKQSWFIVDRGGIPGLAFKNSLPYTELQFADLHSHASNQVQLQFYQEAGIKAAICMGCGLGEMELGMTCSPQVNVEMELKNMFPQHFSSQATATATAAAAAATPAEIRGLSHPLLPIDQNRPSPSSSFSIDSPEYSSLLFNVSSTPYVQESTNIGPIPPVSSSAMPYQQQGIQTLSRIGGLQFPRGRESEDVALTRAYVAVMTSPSSSSSSNYQIATEKATAFRRFRSSLGPNVVGARSRQQNMLKRSITFFRNLNMTRREEQVLRAAPSSTQVHHMISERRRREKLNGSFQLLRSLLPPGTKKDKASVLASTTEYLSSLKAQLEQLSKKNEMLEARLAHEPEQKSSSEANQMAGGSWTGGNERVSVEIINESSTSESRILELQVSVRGECSILDLVTPLLQFLKTHNNVTLHSLAANTTQSGPLTQITFRLTIQGGEWDETAFQEAVKRVVG